MKSKLFLMLFFVSPSLWGMDTIPRISNIPILKSSTIQNHERYIQGVALLEKMSSSIPFERLSYRTIFVSNSFYECNSKGDIWINPFAGTKQVKRHLLRQSKKCLKKQMRFTELSDSINELKNVIQLKYGTRIYKSPMVDSAVLFLSGISKTLSAYESNSVEFGILPEISISDHFSKQKDHLWIDYRASSDEISKFIKKHVTQLDNVNP